ncbi:hypothetical protein E8E12_002413 [Didymella heteroderae]|uniref:Transcription factor n=1 Tax=Didymella heteroderae TaxID=1769908 RepID=A0A9P4WYS4_9PLEO|nr:hypothetical protein E8E12_002413 [Didymella heteroderae]
MPFPNLHDVTVDLETLHGDLHAYVPHGFVVMVEHWVLLIALSKILGEILFLFYQQLGKQPTLTQFEDLEAQLNAFMITEPQATDQSAVVTFSYYHLQLHLRATLITFYRPFVSSTPRGLSAAAEIAWSTRVRSCMESAATQANAVLDCIAREGLVKFATPMTPPLLVPAMHVHLLGCKSENHLTRRLAFNKLEMCMIVMRELQKTHTSASIFCGVFGEAIRQLLPGPFDESVWGVAQIRRPSTAGTTSQDSAQTVNLFDSALQPIVTDDVLESLLNETSSYNYWESFNMPDQAFVTFDRQQFNV